MENWKLIFTANLQTYLLHSSNHPYHTKKSIPYSLALRLRCICSTEIALEKRFKELQHYLVKSGYKERFVKQQIDRTRQIPRQQALQEHKRDNKCDIVPFVIMYNPAQPNIQKILHSKQPLLHSSDRCKEIFKETLVVGYRRSPNLRDLLVRAKLKSLNPPPSFPPGSFRCNSRHGCLIRPHIEDGKKLYTFTSTGETHEIKQHITCNSTNLTYMIECKK